MAVSPFHLSRTYSLLEGEGIKDFIIRMRMELAAKLLLETDKAVLDICMSVGLNSPSHFTQQFKRYYGRSPLAYRKAKGKPLALPGRILHSVRARLYVPLVGGRHSRHV